MDTRHAVVETEQLGSLTVVASGDALVGIYYEGHWTNPDRAAWGRAVDERADRLFAGAASQLRAYLRGDSTAFDLPTLTRGGAFEEQVWSLLRAIPFGETVTYGDLAAALGERTTAARGVGQAVAHNPLSIVVPCHRVIGKNGELRGYAGGLVRKRFLLDLEGAGQLSLGLRG
jgi:methylated-DNA-[protein]-cysteine S-methyltransferase